VDELPFGVLLDGVGDPADGADQGEQSYGALRRQAERARQRDQAEIGIRVLAR
jgi:hypothetical protein